MGGGGGGGVLFYYPSWKWLRRLSETESARILPTNKQAIDLLKEKHPERDSKYDDFLQHGPEELYGGYA